MICGSIHKFDVPPAKEMRACVQRYCQVKGCSVEIKGGQLMCQLHWFELPAWLRNDVYAHLNAWLKGAATIKPYLIVRLKALIYIGELHHNDVTELKTELLLKEKTNET